MSIIPLYFNVMMPMETTEVVRMFIFTVASLHLQTLEFLCLLDTYVSFYDPYVSFYTSMCDCGFFVTCGCACMCAQMHSLIASSTLGDKLFISFQLVSKF